MPSMSNKNSTDLYCLFTDSFLFLFFSMIIIALTLYLPQHLTFLTNRAWFYYNGPESAKAAVESATSTVLGEQIKQTAVSTAGANSASTIWDSTKEL